MTGKINAAAIVEGSAEGHADIMAVVNDTAKTTSAKIRELAAMKVGRSTIAILLNKRYQHVRNVLETKVKGQ